MDFTGGNRDLSQPIIQYYNNVFVGGSTTCSTSTAPTPGSRATFSCTRTRTALPDSSSAMSGGNTGSDTSQITIIGNLFFDCDQAATAKQGNFFTLLNNTIVHMTKTGGMDTAAGVVNVQDHDPGPPTTFGAGFYLEGNIIVDANSWSATMTRRKRPSLSTTTSCPIPWTGPGTGNHVADPLLKHIPQLSETYFTTWTEAQVMRDWFSLLPGSPARGTGPNGATRAA